MFAFLSPVRKASRTLAAISAVLLLSACDPTMLTDLGSGTPSGPSPSLSQGEPVPVALLVPKSDASAGPVALALENATRMAIQELEGVEIALTVYDTAGQADTAAQQAQAAVDAGAKIILGPLFSEAANAAGLAVADDGVNVLSFSNSTAIAGGNVFILGSTFPNSANRLMSHARRQGKKSIVIVASSDVAGQSGRIAIEQAATSNGIRVVSTESYELDEASIASTAQRAAAVVKSGQADTIFVVADPAFGAFPRLMTFLPEEGIDPTAVQYISLIRMDTVSGSFDYPGSEGAWFAIPDVARQNAFNARYVQTFNIDPHPLAGLAFDGIAAIGLLAKQGREDALSSRALTSSGFPGTGGVFRFRSDGTNQRALAIGSVQDKKMVILDPAPSSLSGAGS